MISITIDKLTKTFGNVRALDNVSLRIEPGELFFLLGPSGCGKTTLLRNIAGFYTPDAGRILFGDEDVTRLPPHKRNTGMVFQNYALWPHMTVAQNVAFGLEERKIPRLEIDRRVQEALESVKMETYACRKIAQLSGGQQQRAALARALVIRPRALLLDEPLSNLDAKLRIEMRSEIRRVCKEFELTAVYVTHDQKEALSVADRMAIFENGRAIQIGTPEDVYRRPSSKAVAGFIGETNFLLGKVSSFRDGIAVVDTDLGCFEGVVEVPGWCPRSGESASLSIRPECWTLCDTSMPMNSVSGRIGEIVYLGEVAQCEFVSAGRTLKVFELNPSLKARAGKRDIFANVKREDVVVLPE